MADKDYNIKVTVDASNAVKSIDKIDAGLKQVGKSGETAGKQVDAAMREARGGVIGIVNDLTGGLASKFMDVKDAIGGATAGMKGFKAALIATGVGALVVTLGAIVGYKDELHVMFSDAAADMEKFAAESERYAQAANEIINGLSLEERRLKALGVAEGEILAVKKEKLKLAIQEQRLAVQAQLNALDALAEQEKEFQKGGALGLVGAALYGDPEKKNEKITAAKESLNRLKEFEVQYLETEAAITNVNKAESEKRIATAKTESDEVLKIKIAQVEAIKTIELQAIEQRAGIGMLAVDAEKRAIYETEQAQRDALAKRAANDEAYYKLKQDKIQSELSMQTDVINGLLALNDLFTGNSEKSARRAFKMTKALNVAQALASTYAAVNAQLAVPQDAITGANYVKAGVALAVGLANVKKILSTKFEGGSTGGGGSAPSSSGGGASNGFAGFTGQPPTVTPQTVNPQGQNQPIQAYVLAGNVTSSVEAREKIAQQARL